MIDPPPRTRPRISNAAPATAAEPAYAALRDRGARPFALAAVALLGLAAVRFLRARQIHRAPTPPESVSSAPSQLRDGSTGRTQCTIELRVHLTDQQRDVTLLEGQALFRVAKDKHRPFVVRAGDAQVRAVGTEFDVYRTNMRTVVTVVEGRVETYDDSRTPGRGAIILSAGEQLTVLPHIVTKPTRTDTTVATAWLQKRLIFEETPLSDVAEEFNRYNRRPLTIEDRELRNSRSAASIRRPIPHRSSISLRSQTLDPSRRNGEQVRIVRREAR